MRRTIIAAVAVLGLIATACTAIPAATDTTTDSTTTTSIPPPGGSGVKAGLDIFAAPALQPFASCNEFLDYVQGHALDLVGPYGLAGYGGGYYGDVVFEEVSASLDSIKSEAPAVDGAGRQGVDYSGTNVQVAGVDEPDIVKTDGERIFVVAQGRLFWIDASGTPQVVASMPLEGWGQQLFLSGDRLLVMTSGGGYGIEPFAGRELSSDIAPGYSSPRTVLTEVDVSNPASMQPVRTLTLDGTILSSRMTGGTIRVVISSGPTGFAWEYPQGNGIRAEQEAIESNKKIIEESTIENWVPWYVLEDHKAGTTSDGPLLGCDQVGVPDEFSGLSMLSVLSIDLDSGLEPGNAIGLLAEGQTIYASTDNLYVATAPWMAWPLIEEAGGNVEAADSLTTQIHMFDITDPTTAVYVASGRVDGTLLSQWSMDEYDGTLRVVTTDENRWWGSSDVPDSAVVTLRREGDELVQIGYVDGLGKDERVYAVRFIEDKGYVVTFRQVDPLYIVDLSDPTNPQVTGELKINGYSAYLHPIGEDLLLGVGQDATEEGRTLGTQVSVFDVSDPTKPQRLSRMTFEEAYSNAEWDAKAFLWWAPLGISVLPLQRWSWDERSGKEDNFSGAVVLSADPRRVKQLGLIEHPNAAGDECPDCSWSAPIMRSLVIGDTLYTISETGILASDIETLDDIAWVPFK
ncbi:MAG: beta-propeller domain-containing protein [Actinomycetia bacterium]|nr:beta-propeller domain-containing protein [Actinomycetes bacterium]